MENRINLPTLPRAKLEEFDTLLTKRVGNKDIDDIEDSEDEKKQIQSIYSGNSLTLGNIPTGNLIENKDIVISDKFNGHIKKSSKSVRSGNINGNTLKLMIDNISDVGPTKTIMLRDSGFSIVVRDMNKDDMLKLITDYKDNEESLGYISGVLLNSAHNIHRFSSWVDMLRTKIDSTSLVIPSNKDIFDYIRITDVPLIISATTESQYPNGLPIEIPCCNSYNNLGEVTCTNKYNIDCDVTSLLFVNNDLDLEHKNILRKTKMSSVDIEMQETYTSTLTNMRSSKKLKCGLTLILEVPTINQMINGTLQWLNYVENSATEKITEFSTVEEETNIINSIIDNTSMLAYIHYIKELGDENSHCVEYKYLIDGLTYFKDSDIIDEIKDTIYDFVNSTVTSKIGTASWLCNECRKKIKDKPKDYPENYIEEFDSINIILDPILFFFQVNALKYMTVTDTKGKVQKY